MLWSNGFQATFIRAQNGVEVTFQAVTLSQIIITIILAASLKSMWNLLNVVQVLAYMRFYTRWSAYMERLFTWLDNAITLKPITD